MSRTAVWLDCDPGHDDAFALVLAAHSSKLDLIGVSCVAGNASVKNCVRNARSVLSAIGHTNVPVFAGAARPLVRKSRICPEIHGETGLDKEKGGPVFPHASTSKDDDGIGGGHGALELAQRLLAFSRANEGQRLVLVCTGALTNAALALALVPSLANVIEIVLMGGAAAGGNTGPQAEFNIQVDPDAAQMVLQAGVRVTMVPLDVTHTAIATEKVIQEIRKRVKGAFGSAIEDLLGFFAKTYKDVFGFVEGPPVHDPTAVAYVIAPEIFETKHVRVDVERHSELCLGQTVVDWHNIQKLPPNCHLAVKMDVEKFWSKSVFF